MEGEFAAHCRYDSVFRAGSTPVRQRQSPVVGGRQIEHYNTGRSHQGHGMRLRAPDDEPNLLPFPTPADRIRRQTVLAGLVPWSEGAVARPPRQIPHES